MLSTLNTIPTKHHLSMATSVLRYIKYTIGFSLYYLKPAPRRGKLETYSDVSSNTGPDNLKALGSFVRMLSDSPVA